jgi:hypothetical protein
MQRFLLGMMILSVMLLGLASFAAVGRPFF